MWGTESNSVLSVMEDRQRVGFIAINPIGGNEVGAWPAMTCEIQREHTQQLINRALRRLPRFFGHMSLQATIAEALETSLWSQVRSVGRGKPLSCSQRCAEFEPLDTTGLVGRRHSLNRGRVRCSQMCAECHGCTCWPHHCCSVTTRLG